MTHPALVDTSRRPWPPPARPWSLTMRWEDLVFLHWPVDPARLRPHLPDGLELDLHGGAAWLGVVPFVMARTRFRGLPALPTATRFPELNLRTYVRRDGAAGVWFFSLDAQSRLAVEGARFGFGLPYFRAAMRCAHVPDGRVRYASERMDRRGPTASFAATWRPARGVAPREAGAGSLEQFLVERYRLFATRRGRLVHGDVAHAPWRLRPLDLQLDDCDMTRLLGFDLDGPPASALAADPVDVAAWSPEPA